MRNTVRPKSPFQKQRRITAEQVSFAIASLILATIIGLVLLAWFTEGDAPPVLSVQPQVEQIREANGQFYVPYEVTNKGGETAESVQIVGELQSNGEMESGDQTIDFLSRDEVEEGAFVFSRDPRQGELRIRVASYKVP
ncbi:TIGR02588 family protein [Leptolyngbya ohadii]|uniref:TIGR02588 family protein n=1 Tax=Leptolyngbya ohadii TaxID=1962290 RepID=UPI000B59E8BC|nr:TIGR02588 family protein [Leptolyngbya ohadii]